MNAIKQRLGLPPRQRRCLTNTSCPDIFELYDGRFAVIGTDMTRELTPTLPDDAGVAECERIVVIPRETLILAKPDIPDL
jgi:hypothetical protein